MTLSPRTQFLIGISSIVCIALVTTAVMLLRTIGPGPADLLPADRTLMVVSHLSPDLQRQWQQQIPALAQAPLKETGTPVVALVKGTDGQDVWIVFDAHGNPQTPITLASEEERRLSADPLFRPLGATFNDRAAWMFVRFPEVDLKLTGIRLPEAPVAITIGTGSIALTWRSAMQAAVMGSVPEDGSGAVLRLSAADLAGFLKNASSLLHDDQHLIVTTLLRSWIAKIVGSDISAVYDVLPLLEGPGTILVDDADAAARVLTHGSPDTLDRMSQGAATLSAHAEEWRRTFDDTFSFATVRAGSGGSSPFLSTRRGRDISLGTSQSLIDQLLHPRLTMNMPHIATGFINQPALTLLLQKAGLAIDVPWSLIPGTGNSIHWTLEREGSLAILEIGR